MGSSTYFGKEHLAFKEIPPRKGSKLCMYFVMNMKLGQEIGIIHWRGGWRQYVFTAHPDIDMSRSCQREIIKFIDELMKDWRQDKRSKI